MQRISAVPVRLRSRHVKEPHWGRTRQKGYSTGMNRQMTSHVYTMVKMAGGSKTDEGVYVAQQ